MKFELEVKMSVETAVSIEAKNKAEAIRLIEEADTEIDSLAFYVSDEDDVIGWISSGNCHIEIDSVKGIK